MRQKLRQIKGQLCALWYRFLYADELEKVLLHVVAGHCLSASEQVKRRFVMLVGFSKSGKETLRTHNESLNRAARVDTDVIHMHLNLYIDKLQDDYTVNGKAYWARQFLTRYVRQRAFEYLFFRGHRVLSESCNLTREERIERIALAREYGYETVIIWIQCPEEILLERLKDEDDQLIACGKLPTWRNLYHNVQKVRFERPLPDEADELYLYNSSSMVGANSMNYF